MVVCRLGAFAGTARTRGHRITHRSFHGALGERGAADAELVRPPREAVGGFDPGLVVPTSPSRAVERAAADCGLRIATAFRADRAPDREGLLVRRRPPGAEIDEARAVLERVARSLQKGLVATTDGALLQLHPHDNLPHGDTPGAVALARAVRARVWAAGWTVAAFSMLLDIPAPARPGTAADACPGLEETSMPGHGYRTALVAGASSGIGAAAVERPCREGLEVHAFVRSADRLAALAERTGRIPHPLDVHAAPRLARLAIELAVDLLVDDAGIDRPRNLAAAEPGDIDDRVDVGLRAVQHACRSSVPGTAARDRGHDATVSSIAGPDEFGGNTIRHLTEAALAALARQLRVDPFGRRVGVGEIRSGRVATEIFARVHGDRPELRERFPDGFEPPEPTDAGEAVAFALTRPPTVDIGPIGRAPVLRVPGEPRTARPDAPHTGGDRGRPDARGPGSHPSRRRPPEHRDTSDTLRHRALRRAPRGQGLPVGG